MAAPCLGPCLPWLVTGSGPGRRGPAGLDMPDRTGREAWLEAEVARLSKRYQELAETNYGLNTALAAKKAEADEAAAAAAKRQEEGAREGTLTKFSEAPSLGRRPTITIRDTVEASEIDGMKEDSGLGARTTSWWMRGSFNTVVMRGSARDMRLPVQAAIYTLAVAGVLFVLFAAATGLGAEVSVLGLEGPRHSGSSGHAQQPVGWAEAPGAAAGAGPSGRGGSDRHRPGAEAHGGGHGRRLFGAVPKLLYNIAFSLTGVGFMTLLMSFLRQPLILGYLLGGVLVGPEVLGIVDSHADIAELSELGLIFLLFMIGMELDIKELLKMGKVVLLTGFLQFPICACVMFLVFSGLQAAGLSLGAGPYAALYCGMSCGISSTMIVAKVLSEKGEMGAEAGRLTIGILIFQDIWAIVVLAVQPDLANPEILGILRTFAMIAVLIIIALAYAKLVMPAVLFYASKSVELMLVLSLAWCFFICCTAILPFINLSMELAALIAGVALATFPYSAEFNGKIKFIRDFFITLFFAGLGMQIPTPTPSAIAKGVLVAIVVLAFRWLGIFLVVLGLGGGSRLGALSTINLSQISEFALVICSIGMTYGHVDSDTMTIIIWTFAILAISASYLIGHNALLYVYGVQAWDRVRCRKGSDGSSESDGAGHDHEERDILLLGFHRVASMLIAEFQARNPAILRRLHIIDVNQSIMPQLRERGVKCTYGDYKEADVLEHAHHGEARIVISTIPDSLLQGTTNAQLLKVTREVWPHAHCILTADSPYQAQQLYQEGADYVLRMAKLCAERLQKMLSEHFIEASATCSLKEIFEQYKKRDRDFKQGSQFLSVKV